MALNVQYHAHDVTIDPETKARFERLFANLDKRLVHISEPQATARIREVGNPREFSIDLRVELGSHAGELISHKSAPSADHAMRLAIGDIERQLERRLSVQRGEASFGVPSRRLPKDQRPATASERVEDQKEAPRIDLP